MAAGERITPGAARLPAVPGAYALVIALKRAHVLSIASLGAATLPAGRYLYLGSARGPGGIRARVTRHLRREKRLHWHVDHLARDGRITRVIAVPGGSECDLVARALEFQGVDPPVAGFGSSDCRRCPAHLLRVTGNPAAVLCALAGFTPPPA